MPTTEYYWVFLFFDAQSRREQRIIWIVCYIDILTLHFKMYPFIKSDNWFDDLLFSLISEKATRSYVILKA